MISCGFVMFYQQNSLLGYGCEFKGSLAGDRSIEKLLEGNI